MRRVLPLAVALAIAVAPASAGEADRLLAKAVALHQAGDILGAIQAYQQVLALEPGKVEARSDLGAAYVWLGRYEDAIQQYRWALEREPGHAAVRFNLALALYKAARTPEAADELSRVVAAQPGNKSATLLLADCLLKMGEDKKALELLAPLESSWADDRAYAFLYGTALVRTDQVEKGQVYIDRILRDGESAEARVLMGSAHLAAKDYPSALAELKRAVELSPKLPSVHSLHGRALMGTGDRDAAARAFLRELELNPNDYDANLYLGMLRKDEQRYDDALRYLNRAARLRGRDPGVLYSLGSLYVATGKVAEAREVLEGVVADAPELTRAHVLLATVYYRLKLKAEGDRERAIVEKLTAGAQARQ
jgi:tetratricopeptide (TPR) repeat protein